MLTMLHKGTVSVNPDSMTINETYVIELAYEVTADDVNKREAFMNQIENLVKQYAPVQDT